MRLVKEKDHARLLQVSDLRKLLKQLRKKPQKKSRIQLPVLNQRFRIQNMNHSLSVGSGGKPVTDIQSGFPEEEIPSFSLQCRKRPDDDRNRCRADFSVIRLEGSPVLIDIIQKRLQVLNVHKKKLLLIRNPEGYGKEIRLKLVQPENPGQNERSHLRNGRPKLDSALSVKVPEGHRILRKNILLPTHTDALHPLSDILIHFSGPAHSRKITFHVRKKHRNAQCTEGFRKSL